MANATINRIHFIISGTLAAAVRWGWIATNPASVAKKPRVPAPQPNPPTSEQAARILAAAREVDVDWGTLVWLVMVTGLRRGELLALKWSDVDFDTETLVVRRGIVKVGSRVIEKDTKTHRMRRIALDAETMKVLQEHRARWDVQAIELRLDALDEAYLFSYKPDQSEPYDPSGVTHRYSRMCAGLGINTHLHALRHYSATEVSRPCGSTRPLLRSPTDERRRFSVVGWNVQSGPDKSSNPGDVRKRRDRSGVFTNEDDRR